MMSSLLSFDWYRNRTILLDSHASFTRKGVSNKHEARYEMKQQENQSTMLSLSNLPVHKTKKKQRGCLANLVWYVVSLGCQGQSRSKASSQESAFASCDVIAVIGYAANVSFIGLACRSGFWRGFAVTSHEFPLRRPELDLGNFRASACRPFDSLQYCMLLCIVKSRLNPGIQNCLHVP
jgi:hypothetical protein